MIWTAVLPWSRPEPDPTAAAPTLQAILICKRRDRHPAIGVVANGNAEGWLQSKRRMWHSVGRCFAHVRAQLLQALVHPSTVQRSWRFSVWTEATCIPDSWRDMSDCVIAFGFNVVGASGCTQLRLRPLNGLQLS